MLNFQKKFAAISFPVTVVMWISLAPYSRARIELSNAHKLNDITMANAQRSSNEYINDESFEEQSKLLYETAEQNIRGTLRPETVLSRPYKDKKEIKFMDEQYPRRHLEEYSPNKYSGHLDSNEEIQYDINSNNIDSGVQFLSNHEEMPKYQSPTMAKNDFHEYEKIVSNSIRKRNFLLVQSRKGNILSLHSNKQRPDEHQAQRPPTVNIFPLSDGRFRNISYQYRYGLPEPTFESVSTPDLQIEKVDGTYINASDSTILH